MANVDVTVSKPANPSGGVTFGTPGSTLPKDAKAALGATFKPLGYVNEDGVQLTDDASDEDIKIWGGQKVRKVRSEFASSITFVLYSTRDVDVLKAVFGDKNVESSGSSITVKHNADISPVRPFTVETKDESDFARRFVIPRGQLTVSGDRTLNHSSADGFEVTIDALVDEDGNNYYEYTELPATSATEVSGA